MKEKPKKRIKNPFERLGVKMKNKIMKKVCSNIYNSMNRRILYGIIILNLIFSLNSYVQFINNYRGLKLTFIELVLWNLNNENLITFLFSISFLVLLSQTFIYSKHRYCILMKYHNRTECFIVCFLSNVILSILYVGGLLLLYFFQSIFNLPFYTGWSEMSLDKWGFVFYKTNNPSLAGFILPNAVNLSLYFILIGLAFMFFFLLFNSNVGAWGTMIAIVIVNFTMYKAQISWLYSFSTLGNIVLGFGQKIVNNKVNLGYWLIQIIILSFLCHRLVKKKDLIKSKE